MCQPLAGVCNSILPTLGLHVSCAHSWVHSLSPHFLAGVCNYVLPTIGLYVFCVHSLCAFLGYIFLDYIFWVRICRVLLLGTYFSIDTFAINDFVTFIFSKLWFSSIIQTHSCPFSYLYYNILFCWLFLSFKYALN